MIRTVLTLSLIFAVLAQTVAQADDELVRLPGQGEMKDNLHSHAAGTPDRLAPGGGLLLSFDLNTDGLISADEIELGIRAAFQTADMNADGNLTPLEQLAWAEGLPTRDETLANPARFDPNLDRNVSLEEFSNGVHHLVSVFDSDNSGEVTLASLKARQPAVERSHDQKPRHVPSQRRGHEHSGVTNR